LTISGSDTEMDEAMVEINRTLEFRPQICFEGLLDVVDAPQHAGDIKVLSTKCSGRICQLSGCQDH
jgi:hypothetical protein